MVYDCLNFWLMIMSWIAYNSYQGKTKDKYCISIVRMEQKGSFIWKSFFCFRKEKSQCSNHLKENQHTMYAIHVWQMLLFDDWKSLFFCRTSHLAIFRNDCETFRISLTEILLFFCTRFFCYSCLISIAFIFIIKSLNFHENINNQPIEKSQADERLYVISLVCTFSMALKLKP